MPRLATVREHHQAEVHAESRRLMTAWMADLARAARTGEPAACLMISGNCVEILRAFDIHPMFPEVTALQMAIRKQSLPMILSAEQLGYSGDNCAYVKADVGLLLGGGIGEGAPIPKPSLLVCNYVGCNVYLKWFEHLAEFCPSPLMVVDIPFVREERPTREDIQYVVRGLLHGQGACHGDGHPGGQRGGADLR